MIYLMLLSVNILLLLIYAVFIRIRVSRLTPVYLLLGLFVPIIGEMCMLACEFGYISFEKKDDKGALEQRKNAKAAAPMIIEEYTRESVLNAVRQEPSNLVEILKTALKSSDSEVVHIAASTLMKIQNNYEKDLTEAAERYENLPDNKQYLEEYISALDDYVNADILFGEVKDNYIAKSDMLKNKLERIYGN